MSKTRLEPFQTQSIGNVRWPTSVFVSHETSEETPSLLDQLLQRAGPFSLDDLESGEVILEDLQRKAVDTPFATLPDLLDNWMPNNPGDMFQKWGYFADLTEQISQAMYQHCADDACMVMSRALRDGVFSDGAVSSLIKGNEMYLDRVIAHSARPDVFAAWLEEVSARLVRGGHFDTVSFMLHHLSVEHMDKGKHQNFLPLVQGWAHEIRQSLMAAYALQIRETPNLSELSQKKWASTLSTYVLTFANSELVRNAPYVTGLSHAEAAVILHREAETFWQNQAATNSIEEVGSTQPGYQQATEEQLDGLFKW